MSGNKSSLEQIIKKLQEEEDTSDLKKWYESWISKIILLSPTLIFFITFPRVNNDKSIIDLLAFVLLALILILFGVALNLLLSKK